MRERPKLRTCSKDQRLQKVNKDQAGPSRRKHDRHRRKRNRWREYFLGQI